MQMKLLIKMLHFISNAIVF